MSAKALCGYGLRYLVAYVVASLVVSAIFFLLQSMSIDFGSGSGAGIGIAIGGAVYPLIKFLRDYDRLPNVDEYWTLVLVFTVIGVALEAMKLGLLSIIFAGPFPGSNHWFLALTLAAVLLLLTNMFVFSEMFAGPQLKHLRKKSVDKP